MKTRVEIDQKYLNQANQLEANFFKIVSKGKPDQHRVLKPGKSIGDFNQRHGDIWRDHEAELITGGFIEAPTPPKPSRLDELEQRVADLEAKIV